MVRDYLINIDNAVEGLKDSAFNERGRPNLEELNDDDVIHGFYS